MTDASPRRTADRRNSDTTLSRYTTLRLGGPARELVVAGSSAEAVAALRAAAGPTLVLAGGSNVVIGDAGFDGTVVLLRGGGVERIASGVLDADLAPGEGVARAEAAEAGPVHAVVRVEAGQEWDAFVAWTVVEGLAGVEALSGIPGSAGATPIQNVGAYGQEVAQTIAAVRVWDREKDEIRDWSPAECGFAYRHSVLKHSSRYLVMSVDFRLEASGLSTPIAYAELAKRLGVDVGERAPLGEVRAAVLELRRGKGMVLEEADHDTWSAGSFFTNPVIGAAVFHELAERAGGEPPHWPAGDGLVKVSAAWLIGAAGFAKGHRRGNVGLSTKHTLALTNRGGATTAELLDLAEEVAATVEAKFGVRLRPEPVMVV